MSLKRSSVIHQTYVLKNILEMLLLLLYIPLNLVFCFEVLQTFYSRAVILQSSGESVQIKPGINQKFV
jgi:hypothetical protein